MILLLAVAFIIYIFFRVASDYGSTGSYTPSNTPNPTPTPKQENPVTTHTQEELKAQRVAYYKQSNLMPPIMKFITQHGIPNKVIISLNSIESYYTGGIDRFDFITHGIANFIKPDLYNRKADTSESYYFACAINELLNSPFTVHENNTVVTFRRNDGDLDVGLNFQYVEMTRPLQQF